MGSEALCKHELQVRSLPAAPLQGKSLTNHTKNNAAWTRHHVGWPMLGEFAGTAGERRYRFIYMCKVRSHTEAVQSSHLHGKRGRGTGVSELVKRENDRQVFRDCLAHAAKRYR